MSETNGNGFPLSMKVAYAKDLLVAKVVQSPADAVKVINSLVFGFGFEVPQAENKIEGSGPYPPSAYQKPAPAPTPAPAPQPQQAEGAGPDLKADSVVVKAWAKEPRTGTNGRKNWWKLGVKVHFPTLKLDDWLVVWSPKKAAYLQERKNQPVPITYSVSEYQGKTQYTLEGIDGLED